MTETVTSPTVGNQLQQVLAKYPEAQWHQYEPISRDNVREGARIAFGEMVTTRYHLKEANVILSLDSDFLTTGPGGVRYARDFSSRRDAVDNLDQMNRLYVAESSPTLTGAQADHVLGRRAGEIEGLARMIAAGLGDLLSKSVSNADWLLARQLNNGTQVIRNMMKH